MPPHPNFSRYHMPQSNPFVFKSLDIMQSDYTPDMHLDYTHADTHSRNAHDASQSKFHHNNHINHFQHSHSQPYHLYPLPPTGPPNASQNEIGGGTTKNYALSLEQESRPDSPSRFIEKSAPQQLTRDSSPSASPVESPTSSIILETTASPTPIPKKSRVCKICNREFKRLEHLIRHERIHTGERPFKCDFVNCPKRFSRADNMLAHRKTHERKMMKQ
ncbi:hypothetical protein HK098_004140 [Nowakowskiella sp. JEL0407]|nr:hypothetical protein HK098_004140 [Nowakowskiella sp. JEL0407]